MLPFPSVARGSHIHPDLAVYNVDREAAHIVGPEVERTTTGKVEAGMMPVTGENTIVDGTFIQGEAHMRATVINGVHLTAVREERYDMRPGQHR